MNLIKRVFFFVLINLGLVFSISVFVFALERFFGIRITPSLANGYTSLAVYSLVFGMASAFLSLALSRIMAKWTYSIDPIREERLMDYSSKEQLLYATVARIAKGQGIDMPEVGVYDSAEPNAFATGPTRNRALVAASSGLLEAMNREEIEGVIGHEMTHVLNGDMVTMTLLQGVLNAVVIFVSRILASVISSALSRSDESRGWVYPIAVIVIQTALGFAALLVLMIFSRYREYRADEGSARLLGKDRMIAALRRLQSLHERLTGHVIPDSKLEAMQITTYSLASLFSSHPPLEKRIQALEERYDLA